MLGETTIYKWQHNATEIIYFLQLSVNGSRTEDSPMAANTLNTDFARASSTSATLSGSWAPTTAAHIALNTIPEILERILAITSFVDIENARLVSRFWRNVIGNVKSGSTVLHRASHLIPDPTAETKLVYLSVPRIPGSAVRLGRFQPPTTEGLEPRQYQGKPVVRVYPRFVGSGIWLATSSW